MSANNPLPHLFREEYSKIVAVLSKLFGIGHIEVAEDIVSETFLMAAELWGMKGVPENPNAWLYTVAKNKTKNYLKRNQLFDRKISQDLKHDLDTAAEIDIDLSEKNIADSQLAMMFAVCNPCISSEAQVGLALNLLCGFGTDEIANAFLTNKEVIYKRLQRAKATLKNENITLNQPTVSEINLRLPNVLTTLYLLFNEGYHSSSQNTTVRKELCLEAMRLNYLLANNPLTNLPSVNALLSLMCFHASRFEARMDSEGELILYEDQDTGLWDHELIGKGIYFLNLAFENLAGQESPQITKYHLEAGIAYCHTQKTEEKWNTILQLYNQLLQIDYSPVIAMNRTYALSRVQGKEKAISEAEKLQLTDNHFYYSLLGNLYTDINNRKAAESYEKALSLANSASEINTIKKNLAGLSSN